MKESTKTLTASDESKNLHGFTTLTDGIDLTDFNNNPVLLYIHDYDKLLGLCIKVVKVGNTLQYVPSFDEDDKYAMKQYSKVEQDILRGSSIGIVPIEYDEANNIMRRCSLKEISLTPVPSNRNAITLYNADGKRLSDPEAKQYLLSLSATPQQDVTQNLNMKPSLITALVALCVQAGHTITLSDKSTEDEFEAGVRGAYQKIVSLSASNSQLSAKVTEMETAVKATAAIELKALLDDGVEKKLFTADQRSAFEQMGVQNLSALKTVLLAMKPVDIVAVKDAKEPTASETDERAKWTFDDFALKAPQDLEKMQISDPKGFEKLLSVKLSASRSKHSIDL